MNAEALQIRSVDEHLAERERAREELLKIPLRQLVADFSRASAELKLATDANIEGKAISDAAFERYNEAISRHSHARERLIEAIEGGATLEPLPLFAGQVRS